MSGRGESSIAKIGVDTGGTFTDLVLIRGREVVVAKVASTPRNPALAVLEGYRELAGEVARAEVVHGTTVALNALLTGSLARTALVTNEGFADLIEIGRGDRPDLYELHPVKPLPIVPRALRFEVAQRSWPREDGHGLETPRSPSRKELARLRRTLERAGAQSIAVCLLHAYADPAIEEQVGSALEGLGLPITLSSRVLAEYREYERFSTAVVNASLVPLMRDYLSGLQKALAPAKLSILQSNGGTLAAERAALEPVRVLFSGPAGGVVGASRAASEAGFERMVALDMGGTSTDVAFHDSRAKSRVRTDPSRVAGHPIAVPSLDIHTIGCGGGSIVRIDRGGVLQVGPASAGADPGPLCYGKGEELTVTDAHVLLGHIAQGSFVAGALPLDLDRVERAFEKLGARLGVKPVEAALAVLAVARAQMRRALGVMTMQRGQDPSDLLLTAFGGAGPLHAAALASSLRMKAALVPGLPGLLSAHGMASADGICEISETVLIPLAAWKAQTRRKALSALEQKARAQLREAGHSERSIESLFELDLRYAGQSYELCIPEGRDPASAFHREHKRLYGTEFEERELELVNLRVRAIARAPLPRRSRTPSRHPLPGRAIAGERSAWFERKVKTPVIDRESLPAGCVLEGPAIIEEFSATSLVPPRWRAQVTSGGHLLLSAAQAARAFSRPPR